MLCQNRSVRLKKDAQEVGLGEIMLPEALGYAKIQIRMYYTLLFLD